MLLKEERLEPVANLGVFAQCQLFTPALRGAGIPSPGTALAAGLKPSSASPAGADHHQHHPPGEILQVPGGVHHQHHQRPARDRAHHQALRDHHLQGELCGTPALRVPPLGGCWGGLCSGGLRGSWAEPRDDSGPVWGGCAIALGLSSAALLPSRSWEVLSLICSPN